MHDVLCTVMAVFLQVLNWAKAKDELSTRAKDRQTALNTEEASGLRVDQRWDLHRLGSELPTPPPTLMEEKGK